MQSYGSDRFRQELGKVYWLYILRVLISPQFINLLAGTEVAKVGHTSESTTHAMEEVNVMMDGRQIRIVDSPGFDDTHLDDYEILRRISDWFAATYAPCCRENHHYEYTNMISGTRSGFESPVSSTFARSRKLG
jgi:hypothetical protein